MQEMIPAAGMHSDPFANSAPGTPGMVKAGPLGQPASTALGLARPTASASDLGQLGPNRAGQGDAVSHGRALLERAMLGPALPESEARPGRANGGLMWPCLLPGWDAETNLTCHVHPCSS